MFYLIDIDNTVVEESSTQIVATEDGYRVELDGEYEYYPDTNLRTVETSTPQTLGEKLAE